MTKLKKRWILFSVDLTKFVPILLLLQQMFGSSVSSTTKRTPIQQPPQNYEGQAPWQRRSSQQYPRNQEPRNGGTRNQDIPWEQEQLLPMQGYQGRNQGIQNSPGHSELDTDAIRKEMSNKELSLRETQQRNTDRNPDAQMRGNQTQWGQNSQGNQTAWNGQRSNQERRPTAPPYWYDRSYEDPYGRRPYRGGRPYPEDRYGRNRVRPPTYPPPTQPLPYDQGGPGRGGGRQAQGTGPGPRGWDRGGPYNNRQRGGYYNPRDHPNYGPGPGVRGRGSMAGGAGSGVGSGHLMMVDPDLPDPLDDHWQRMQTHKAWELMNGGPGKGPVLPPFVPPRRWGDRGEIPGGPTTPPWPNMDKRPRQNTGRARIWAREGSGSINGESGRRQFWSNQWPSTANRTEQLNGTANNTNTTGNTPTMKEFSQSRGRQQTTGGQTLPPPPPPTDLLHNSPFQTQILQNNRDLWDRRMQQLAAWERQQHTGSGPLPYPPQERPDSLKEAKREEQEDRFKGKTPWPNLGQIPDGSMTRTGLGRSGVRFPEEGRRQPPLSGVRFPEQGSRQPPLSGVRLPEQGSRRPPLKLSDLSPSLASIVRNLTHGQNQRGFAPNQDRLERPAMTHTFPPYQQSPETRNQFTNLHGGVIPRRGEQLQTSNIPMRPYTEGGNQKAYIGENNQTKEANQTDPDGPVGREVWQTPGGQRQLSQDGSMLGPILARAKLGGFDIDHEQESELESEDSKLRKIIVGMYMEKLAIKDGEGGSGGYDPFQAAIADVNSTLWSTLKNISSRRDNLRGRQGLTGRQDTVPTRSAAAQIPTDRQRIWGGPQQTMPNQGQGWNQGQSGSLDRRFPPINPMSGRVIPHMDTVLQRPTGIPTVTGRGLNPLLVRGGNSNTPTTIQNQQPPTWPQSNGGQGSPPSRPAYNPHNPRNVFVPQGVYPQTYNPKAYDPQQVYNVQGQDKFTVAPPITPSPPQDTNNNDQNNDHNELEEILPVGTKILPNHIPKILAILNITVPMTTPHVIVASQMDGVRPGNNNVPARMVNIPGPTEEIQTATEFYQQEASTQRTVVTESTSSAFGIIIACLVACAVVVGPGVCIGCRMRQRSKQRERKKAAAAATRNEESGIMEAIIMSELGRSALNREERPTKGARPKSRCESGTFHELQTLRSGRSSPTIIVH